MFYSHDYLTCKKYGIATVWIMATHSPQSKIKMPKKREILDVNLREACSTIIDPDVPLALRLGSNLLFGLTRVYEKKWYYLLSDVQDIQARMRNFKISADDQIDKNAGKARPDQLMVEDDPAFFVDNILEPPPLDFDILEFHSQKSERELYLQKSNRETSTPGLDLPSSIHVRPSSYELPPDDSFGHPLIPSLESDIRDDDLIIAPHDDLFEVDADGNIYELPDDASGLPRSLSTANGRVRKENNVAKPGSSQIDSDGDFDMNRLENPESVDSSSVSFEAPQKLKKARVQRVLVADQKLEFRNSDMQEFTRDYVDNMIAQDRTKINRKATAAAKNNAFYYIFGGGINAVGEMYGLSSLDSIHTEFSGKALMSKILGQPPTSSTGGRNRARSSSGYDEHSVKRIRKEYALEDDVMLSAMDDNVRQDPSIELELGMEAASALHDHRSSAMMPWSVSKSAQSYNRSSAQRLVRRLTFASPLSGYGSKLPVDIDAPSPQHYHEMITYGSSDHNEYPVGRSGEISSGHIRGTGEPQQSYDQYDNLEPFGTAADVDMQMIGTSKRDPEAEAKAQEIRDFLKFVKNTILEKKDVDKTANNVIAFSELFDPKNSSDEIAAEAFFHVLTLANLSLIRVEQNQILEYGEVGRDIRITLMD